MFCQSLLHLYAHIFYQSIKTYWDIILKKIRYHIYFIKHQYSNKRLPPWFEDKTHDDVNDIFIKKLLL